MKLARGVLNVAFSLAACSGLSTLNHAQSSPGAVYTMNNSVDGNRVLVFARAADGTLTPAGSFGSGGLGTCPY